MKAYAHIKIYMWTLIAALFVNGQKLESNRRPLPEEQINYGTSIKCNRLSNKNEQAKWGWTSYVLCYMKETKIHSLFNSIYITFWKRQNNRDEKWMSSCQSLWVRGTLTTKRHGHTSEMMGCSSCLWWWFITIYKLAELYTKKEWIYVI